MKDTRRPGTEKISSLWKGLTSGIIDKIKHTGKNISEQNASGDMGGTHTPVSRLDLTGLNREQAKELIGRIIDEKLNMISSLEMTEPEIDYRERERLRAKAEKRINERRNRRKKRIAAAAETIVTDQGVYSDFKHASVFDVIQPESFPFEESAPVPIEGQLSILDAVPAAEKAAESGTDGDKPFSEKFKSFFKKKDNVEFAADPDLFKPRSFDLFGIFPYNQEKAAAEAAEDEAVSETAADKTAVTEIVREAAAIESAVTAASEKENAAAAKAAVNEPAVIEKAASAEAAAEALSIEVPPIEDPAEVKKAYVAEEPAAFFAACLAEEPAEVPAHAAGPREKAGKFAFPDGIRIDTSLDEAVDKVFALFNKYKKRLLLLCRRISRKTSEIMGGKVLPVLSSGMRRVRGWLTPLLQKLESRLQIRNKAAGLQAALSAQEKKASEKMARFVEALDKTNEAFLRGAIAFKDKICCSVNRVRDFAEANKKGILIKFGIGVAAVAAVTLTIGNATAYEYVYNGKVLGVVKNQEDVYQTIDIIGDKLSAQYDADITIDKDEDIRFNKIVLALNQEVDDKEDILNRLTYMRDMKANGKGIYVDGSLMAILDSEKTAEGILKDIQNEYLKKDSNVQYEKIGFAEDIVIKDVETKLGDIETKDKVLEYMLTGAVEKKYHVVQSGETFSEIAKMYGLKQSELQITNPDVIPEKLHIGQEICLNQIVPLVTVQTTEIAQYKEEIPYDIAYENTASLFKNEQTVKSKGVNGEKDVVAEIVRNNGVEVSRNELSANILSQPVSQVVLVGTKEPPPLIGTGTFIYPIRGTLTSRFGTRWGRLHAGIDLAAPIGTHIKAADGGKVTFAGYNGALGYMVEIDHGGGRVTWYGHCSKLFVKKGDKVYQGQHIANVGNTGRSTGPHVHFEVHINGKAKNPLNYL